MQRSQVYEGTGAKVILSKHPMNPEGYYSPASQSSP
jgi:hypothetical protein